MQGLVLYPFREADSLWLLLLLLLEALLETLTAEAQSLHQSIPTLWLPDICSDTQL